MSAITDAWLENHRIDPGSLAAAPLIGIGHVEAELASLAARLADPARAALLGAEVPRGILLHGPAGIGKTHTARNLARRLGDVPMYEVVADELSGSIVRDLFAALGSRHNRAVLVIDEIDLVGGERSEMDAGVRRTLASLLTALDGLRTAAGVLVVAASSRPAWELDQALLRAGRLGFTIEIARPDTADRSALLRHFLDGRPLAGEVDYTALAGLTGGWTPAELKAACADAAGLALADGRDSIADADLRKALERAGRILPEPPEEEPLDLPGLRRVCVHEAGHAVAGAVLHGVDWLRSIGIGADAGFVRLAPPAGDEADMTEHDVRDALAVAFAGMAAERVVLAGATLAHGNDVEGASDLARRLVAAGLEPSIPPLDLDDRGVRGSALGSRAFDAVATLLAGGRERAQTVVASHRDLTALVAGWIETEAIAGLSVHPRPHVADLDPEPLRARLREALEAPAALPGSTDGHSSGPSALARVH